MTSHPPEHKEVQEPWFRPGKSKGLPGQPFGPGEAGGRGVPPVDPNYHKTCYTNHAV